MIHTKSESLYKEAQEKMPGGVNSPVRAFKAVGKNPIFIDHAKGSKMVDVDGNTYIDYVCSWGPNILGHSHPRVIEAVKKACEKGLTYGAPTENEVTLAKLISEMIPSMEMVRLVSSGTEAVMSAIRVARGYTKRDMIIKFKGCYHGHSDALLVKAGSAALTTAVPDSAGVPSGATQNTLIANYNDEASVREFFECYKGKIAAVIVEPVAANMGLVLPKEGFLEFLREITREEGSLLIFDEVITGFRLGLSGAQGYFGVEPDLTTLGKIVGGGMPIGAYGGKKEIMEMVSPIGPVYQAGTLSGNPIATTAGIETLKLLKEDPAFYTNLEQKAKRLKEVAEEHLKGQAVVNQIGSLLSIFFTTEPVVDYETATASDTKAYADFFNYLLENGIYIAPAQFEALFLSLAHTDEDIERTCEIIRSYATSK